MNADEAAGKRDDPQAPDPGSPVPVIAYATNCYSGVSLD
jgi:hypothetical protein